MNDIIGEHNTNVLGAAPGNGGGSASGSGGGSAPNSGGGSAPNSGGASVPSNGGAAPNSNSGFSSSGGGASALSNGGASAPSNGGGSAPNSNSGFSSSGGGASAFGNGGASAPSSGGAKTPLSQTEGSNAAQLDAQNIDKVQKAFDSALAARDAQAAAQWNNAISEDNRHTFNPNCSAGGCEGVRNGESVATGRELDGPEKLNADLKQNQARQDEIAKSLPKKDSMVFPVVSEETAKSVSAWTAEQQKIERQRDQDLVDKKLASPLPKSRR